MAQRLILLSSARFAPALAHSRPDSFEVEPAICRRPIQLMQLTEIWKTQEPLTGNHLGLPFLSSASARLDSLLVLPARPSRSPRITALPVYVIWPATASSHVNRAAFSSNCTPGRYGSLRTVITALDPSRLDDDDGQTPVPGRLLHAWLHTWRSTRMRNRRDVNRLFRCSGK